jgi:hypothetical protein
MIQLPASSIPAVITAICAIATLVFYVAKEMRGRQEKEQDKIEADRKRAHTEGYQKRQEEVSRVIPQLDTALALLPSGETKVQRLLANVRRVLERVSEMEGTDDGDSRD